MTSLFPTKLFSSMGRRTLKVLTSVTLSTLMLVSVLGATALPAGASTTLNSVTVGTQVGTVTTAGGTITFPVTVTETHGGQSYHDINVTAVSDASAIPNGVSFGTAPACQMTNSSTTSYTFTLTVNVPAGDNAGTFANSLVATATDYSSSAGTCNGGVDSTLQSTGTENGTLTIGASSIATTTTLTAPFTPVAYGAEASHSFSGTVTGVTNDGFPKGTVAVKSGATTLCSVTLPNGSGIASPYTCTPTATEYSAGSYANLVATYTPGTPSSSNGSITYATSSSTPNQSQTVTAAALGVTATSGTITFGGSFTPTETPTGLQGSDAISSVTYTYAGTGSTTYGPSTTQPTAVGTYSITPSAAVFSTGAASDYTITYTAGTFTINPVTTSTSTTLNAPTASITYGSEASNPFSGSVNGQPGDGYPEGTITIKNGTTTLCAVTLPIGSGHATSFTCTPAGTAYPVGSYSSIVAVYTPGNPSSSTSGITYGSSTSSIQSQTVTTAALSVTANSGTITFGGSFTASETPTGLQGSDAISSVTYTFAGTGSTSYGPSTTQPTNAGTYSITPSAAVFSSGAASNYSITYTAGTLTINRAISSTSVSPNSINSTVTFGAEGS
ncbi:MAG TPA: MBG domain-containing protein, partial [Acidimicrobiales bacterium]|nr:MBG domain-containing protein [Acidimicrobiales bacterium]